MIQTNGVWPMARSLAAPINAGEDLVPAREYGIGRDSIDNLDSGTYRDVRLRLVSRGSVRLIKG